MARREGEIVRVRDKQLYLREDVAWTDAGHQRLEKKIAEDSVDEERRCQHAADPPRFAEHQQQRCQRHPENTGVSQTGNLTATGYITARGSDSEIIALYEGNV